MTGRAAVASLKQRLDATFQRSNSVGEDPEILSDFARYLCVLVSGFLEQSVVELLLEHVRRRSDTTVQRHVEAQLKRQFTNAKSQRLIGLMSTFDPAWGSDLEAFLIDGLRDAVDSVVDLRNSISHGRSVGVTVNRIRNYYTLVARVVEHVADLCLPAGS
jgi:hypothetical protein